MPFVCSSVAGLIICFPTSDFSRAARKLRALRSSRLKLLTRCSVGSRGPCIWFMTMQRWKFGCKRFCFTSTLLSKGESEERGILVGDVGQLWMAPPPLSRLWMAPPPLSKRWMVPPPPLSRLFSRVQMECKLLSSDREEHLLGGGEANAI